MSREFDYRLINAKETDYRPRRKGTGFNDWLKNKTAARPEDDRFAQFFFRAIIAAAPLTKFAPTDALIKKVARLGNKSNTKGISVPLWVNGEKPSFGPGNPAMKTSRDSSQRAPKSVHIELNKPLYRDVHPAHPPYEVLKETVSRASYRALMNECLCRKIQGCEDYPLDLGCLFIGPAAQACVERGIAREAGLEECLAHIDRAREAGLSAVAYFVEVEEYAWGFRDADMPNFMEICFCCPCCCSAVRFEKRAGGELKRILHQGSGWSCVVDESKCTGCASCMDMCPRQRLNFEEKSGRPVVHPSCAGCGQCLKFCPSDALSVVQTGKTKERIEDYFEKLHATF